MNIVDYLKAGSRLNSISRICDLIKIDFISEGKVICLHSQSAKFGFNFLLAEADFYG